MQLSFAPLTLLGQVAHLEDGVSLVTNLFSFCGIFKTIQNQGFESKLICKHC